jgi:hypothetical protein
VCRLGHPSAAQQQANAAQQQQPQTPTPPDDLVPAGATDLRIEPGSLSHTMMSANATNRGQTPPIGAPHPGTVVSDNVGDQVYCCTITKLMYSINSDLNSYVVIGSLMDGGANGGLAGEDVAILSICERSKVYVSSISDTTVLDLTLAQVADVITTQSGQQIIAMFHKYANLGKGRSIHFIGELEESVWRSMQDLNT